MGRDAVEQPGERFAASLRSCSVVLAGAQAAQLESVAGLAGWVRAEIERRDGPGEPSAQDVLAIEACVVDEVAVVLGMSSVAAGRLVELAERVTSVFPDTLAALAAGRLDLTRVRVLSDLTGSMSPSSARLVEAHVLPALEDGPWEGPSPRAWRQRICRAVLRVDADAARRRRVRCVAERAVTTWSNGDGSATLQAVGPVEDIVAIERAVTGWAEQLPERLPDGSRYRLAQRRFDGLTGAAHRALTGACPGAGPRRGRDVGVVLHLDALFGDGPAADQPGELRGLGAPAPLDTTTARELAGRDLAGGGRLVAMVADDDGLLGRVVPLGAAPAGGWTRRELVNAVRAALPGLPPLRVPGYVPTAAIVEHVGVAYSRCTFYDCARAVARCDIDHDIPWPRGPTAVGNLNPKCRRHHDRKTRRLVRTEVGGDGSVTWTMLTGLTITTPQALLPGMEGRRGGRTRSAA